MSAGYDATCALLVDRRIVCWGRNNRGQAQPQPPQICSQLVRVRNQQLLGNMVQSHRQMQFVPKRKSCGCSGSGCKCDQLELEFSAAAYVVLFGGKVWCAWGFVVAVVVVWW